MNFSLGYGFELAWWHGGVVLLYDDVLIARNWIEIIDWLEYLQCFQRNMLRTSYEYDRDIYTFSVKQKDGLLRLICEITDKEPVYLEKVECAQIAHKINRVLSRVDIFRSES